MSENKRFDFNLIFGEDEHKGTVFDNGKVLKTIDVVYLLNELSEENEWLKKSIKRQQSSNEECSKYIEEIVKENKELKQRIKELEKENGDAE